VKILFCQKVSLHIGAISICLAFSIFGLKVGKNWQKVKKTRKTEREYFLIQVFLLAKNRFLIAVCRAS
jgi:hypothetical protein